MPAPVSTYGEVTTQAIVRMRHPKHPNLYYSASRVEWVELGYTTWTLADWLERFHGQNNEGRLWEFFGERIDIWEGTDEITYSTE